HLSNSVHLDLSKTGTQAIDSNLSLTLSNPNAFNQVVGSAFPDTIMGNARGDTLIGAGGADWLQATGGNNTIQAGITQVVYLDFTGSSSSGTTSPTSPNYTQDAGTTGQSTTASTVHVYTQAERDAIQARLGAVYAAFNYQFTQTRPTSGDYVDL